MPFPNDIASLLVVLSKLPHKKIATGVAAVLLIYVAYLAAQLTWLMVPQDNTRFNASNFSYEPRGKESAFKVNIETLSALNLFGEHSGENSTDNEMIDQGIDMNDVPETKLKLTLSGVVASSEKSLSAAIIEHSGSQETYGVGDKITGTRARLDSVMPDRVIIKVSGRLETLMLDGTKYGQPVSSAPANAKQRKNKKRKKDKVIDKRDNKGFSEKTKALRKDLNANPGKITDYLKILPKRKSGNIIGYSLRAGKDPEFFKSSGLKTGDVAIQMNGLDLTEPLQAAEALKALKTEQEISLLVDRDGEMTQIIFGVN